MTGEKLDEEQEVVLERVCGKVVSLIPKTKKIGVKMLEEGMKFEETYWAWMDGGVVKAKDGTAVAVGDVVIFDYSKNVRPEGGYFKNVEGFIEKVDMKAKPVAKPQDSKPQERDVSEDFQPASSLNMVQQIADEFGTVQSLALKVTEKNIGRVPKTDGEMALVNTGVIHITKEMYFRNKRSGEYPER